MKKNSLFYVIFSLFIHGSVEAAIIDLSEISASTDLPELTLGGLPTFSIDRIIDGNVSDAFPYNGFASRAKTGTVSFDFSSPYDLNSFTLWNDINVRSEGVKKFRFDFFGPNNDQKISTNFLSIYDSALGEVGGQTFVFDNIVSSVSRINLEILSSSSRIEIREVAFDGEKHSVRVSEPGSAIMLLLGGAAIFLRRKRNDFH